MEMCAGQHCGTTIARHLQHFSKSNQIKPSILRIDPFDPPHSSVSFLKVGLGVVPGVRGEFRASQTAKK